MILKEEDDKVEMANKIGEIFNLLGKAGYYLEIPAGWYQIFTSNTLLNLSDFEANSIFEEKDLYNNEREKMLWMCSIRA